jgi:hypothetical protein
VVAAVSVLPIPENAFLGTIDGSVAWSLAFDGKPRTQPEWRLDKFLGLSALFGDGCQTVLLGDQDFAKNLGTAIARLWEAAEHVRPSLLEEAARQIQLGHEAYRRIRAEIAARN